MIRTSSEKRLALLIVFMLFITAIPAFPVKAASSCDALIEEMLQAGSYAEGEAVVVVRGTSDLRIHAESEALSALDADTIGLAIQKELEDGKDIAQEAQERFSPDDEYMLLQVRDDSLSTKELLMELYDDPRVLSAEPNYDVEAPASINIEDTEAEASFLPADAAPNAGTPGDLTPYQWYNSDSSEHGTKTPEAMNGAGYSLHVPGWNGDEENAAGTIAVMDTGIDTTHPDLQGVLYEFSEEQQDRFGCGLYGKNVNQRQGDTTGLVPEEEYQRDVTDHMMHGTHIAGMIAANWDGSGISGIANGVKVFAVRVYADDGTAQSSTDIYRGFEWLTGIAKEVNLKAVNVSLGTLKYQLVHTIMVNKLGEQGVNTVYAAGNMAMDMDETLDLGAENNSPYAITVDAANPEGKMTQFSCYGQMSTDVFAPGAQILSSIPERILEYGERGRLTDSKIYRLFFPETTDTSDLAYGRIEKFEEGTPSVRFFDVCPVNEDGTVNQEANEIGEANTTYGFDDTSSWEINALSLPEPEDTWMSMYYRAYKSFWMAVPVENADDAYWVGGKAAFNDKTHIYSGVTSVVLARKEADGSILPNNVDMRYDNALGTNQFDGAPGGSVGVMAQMSYSSAQWAQWSLDLKGFVDGAAFFHTLDDTAREEAGYGLDDPGDITGVYTWEDNGENYILLQIATMRPEDELPITSSDTCYLMDDVAVGGESSATGSYLYMNGTSMAAPCVTASLAIIAKDEPQNASLSEEELKMLALERAAKLLASVDYDDDLVKLCSTGGRLNLHGQTEYTKKAPLLTGAEAEGTTLTISGYFFTESGKLYINDEEYKVLSWSEHEITADVDGLSNGSHVAKVVNGDEAISRIIFSTSLQDEGRKLYEQDLSLMLDNPGFEEDMTDGFSGTMTCLDGSLYALSCDRDALARALWRYDIEADQWSRCSDLPEETVGMTVENNALAAIDGTLYMYGYRKGLTESEAVLYTYHPETDAWEMVEIEGLRAVGQMVSYQDMLLLFAEEDNSLDESDEGSEEKKGTSRVNRIDLEAGRVVPLKDTLQNDLTFRDLKVASAGDVIYLFGKQEDETGDSTLFLSRLTYDEEKQEFSSEDVSDAISGLLKDMNNNAIIGTDDSLVIITPQSKGSDTYCLKNDAKTAIACSRTSCYHTPFSPCAGYAGGKLYVLAFNTTEPNVLYFRAAEATSWS